ncbi:MAG TPA: tetratricopeptide repeat protein, partial [Flavobacterium sp.]|nr:tetratricopeptide repeat protein [Flavobacterium sp.]
MKESKKYTYSNLPKAEFYLNKAKDAAERSNDNNLNADVAHNFGATYYIIGSYEIALQKFLEALDLYEKENNKEGILKCYIGQGLIQQGIGRNREAIKLFEKAIDLNKDVNNDALLSRSYFNIGISESELYNFEKAYQNFHKSLRLASKAKNTEIMHQALNRLGDIHLLRNKLDSSKYYFQKIIEDKDANLWEKSFAYSGLAENFLKQKNFKEAEKAGIKGYQAAL